MTSKINSIEDLVRASYPSIYGGHAFAKTDAPGLTSTSGFFNDVYGHQVWTSMNNSANMFGVLPKVPWDKSGFRVKTARAITLGSAVGTAENGSIPDSVKPIITTVSTDAKDFLTHIENSARLEYMATQSNDDAIGEMEMLSADAAVGHQEHINYMLLSDVDTTASNNFESVDRVCSSYSEVSALLDANDGDIYGIDRDSSASWADAYVSHNSGSDRALSDDLIRTTMENVYTNGGKPNLWFTGLDSYRVIQGLYSDQVRYSQVETMKVQLTMEGVRTAEGTPVGINIPSLYGIPLFTDPNVTKDTISRVYLLDTSNPEQYTHPRLCFKTYQPTKYLATDQNDYLLVGKLNNEAAYWTGGELICTMFAAQGKLRDLKAS